MRNAYKKSKPFSAFKSILVIAAICLSLFCLYNEFCGKCETISEKTCIIASKSIRDDGFANSYIFGITNSDNDFYRISAFDKVQWDKYELNDIVTMKIVERKRAFTGGTSISSPEYYINGEQAGRGCLLGSETSQDISDLEN